MAGFLRRKPTDKSLNAKASSSSAVPKQPEPISPPVTPLYAKFARSPAGNAQPTTSAAPVVSGPMSLGARKAADDRGSGRGADTLYRSASRQNTHLASSSHISLASTATLRQSPNPGQSQHSDRRPVYSDNRQNIQADTSPASRETKSPSASVAKNRTLSNFSSSPTPAANDDRAAPQPGGNVSSIKPVPRGSSLRSPPQHPPTQPTVPVGMAQRETTQESYQPASHMGVDSTKNVQPSPFQSKRVSTAPIQKARGLPSTPASLQSRQPNLIDGQTTHHQQTNTSTSPLPPVNLAPASIPPSARAPSRRPVSQQPPAHRPVGGIYPTSTMTYTSPSQARMASPDPQEQYTNNSSPPPPTSVKRSNTLTPTDPAKQHPQFQSRKPLIFAAMASLPAEEDLTPLPKNKADYWSNPEPSIADAYPSPPSTEHEGHTGVTRYPEGLMEQMRLTREATQRAKTPIGEQPGGPRRIKSNRTVASADTRSSVYSSAGPSDSDHSHDNNVYATPQLKPTDFVQPNGPVRAKSPDARSLRKKKSSKDGRRTSVTSEEENSHAPRLLTKSRLSPTSPRKSPTKTRDQYTVPSSTSNVAYSPFAPAEVASSPPIADSAASELMGERSASARARKGSPLELGEDVMGQLQRSQVLVDEDPFAKADGVVMVANNKNSESRFSVDLEHQNVVEVADHVVNEEPALASHRPVTPTSPDRERRRHRKDKKLQKERPRSTINGIEVRGDLEPRPFPLASFVAKPQMLSGLLTYMTFAEWCVLSSVSKDVRNVLFGGNEDVRETVLERYLSTVGYRRWSSDWEGSDPLPMSLSNLNDYMRGVSMPTYQYASISHSYVKTLATPHSLDGVEGAESVRETVSSLASGTRAYTRLVLRLRVQAEAEQRYLLRHPPLPQPANLSRGRSTNTNPVFNTSPPISGTRTGNISRSSSRAPSPSRSMFSHGHSSHGHGGYGYGYTGQPQPASRPPSPPSSSSTFRSPLFRLRRAPLLRVFVPSPEGDWLSDANVLQCEKELKDAVSGMLRLLRPGDVVWDVAVGDEGNAGRMVWDGSYLIDLDYTYASVGDLPKYVHALAFPPSYFHRIIRTGPGASNPIVHIDISPWGEQIAANLQLLQDRVRTETPQGAHHNVVRWVHRSSFQLRPTPASQRHAQNRPARIPIPDASGLFVDVGWYGTVVVETEGTNEHLADLQDRCGPRAFPSRAAFASTGGNTKTQERRKVFRILREKSRPGEIWLRAVDDKERQM